MKLLKIYLGQYLLYINLRKESCNKETKTKTGVLDLYNFILCAWRKLKKHAL